MRRSLVVGVGNPLREDDGVGWHLAEALAQTGVPTHTCHQLLPELAAELSQVDLVLFVDARAEGLEAHARSVEVRRGK